MGRGTVPSRKSPGTVQDQVPPALASPWYCCFQQELFKSACLLWGKKRACPKLTSHRHPTLKASERQTSRGDTAASDNRARTTSSTHYVGSGYSEIPAQSVSCSHAGYSRLEPKELSTWCTCQSLLHVLWATALHLPNISSSAVQLTIQTQEGSDSGQAGVGRSQQHRHLLLSYSLQ